MTKRNLDLVYRNSVPFTRQIISKLKALGHEYQDGVDRLLGPLLDYEEIKTQIVVARCVSEYSGLCFKVSGV